MGVETTYILCLTILKKRPHSQVFDHATVCSKTTEKLDLRRGMLEILIRCLSLREKLIKIGAKVVSHGRYVTFQLAEVAVSPQMFADILSLIARLRGLPAPA